MYKNCQHPTILAPPLAKKYVLPGEMFGQKILATNRAVMMKKYQIVRESRCWDTTMAILLYAAVALQQI